jgi:hypothetical protein
LNPIEAQQTATLSVREAARRLRTSPSTLHPQPAHVTESSSKQVDFRPQFLRNGII